MKCVAEELEEILDNSDANIFLKLRPVQPLVSKEVPECLTHHTWFRGPVNCIECVALLSMYICRQAGLSALPYIHMYCMRVVGE